MTYSVTARNFSAASDNKIHSDEIAKKYGFTGALVPGVAVFGHLVHPLVEQHGQAWLNRSVSALRLFKPAYHGDSLTIEHDTLSAATAPSAVSWQTDPLTTVSTAYGRGELLATLHSQLPETSPTPFATPEQIGIKPAGRPLMTWESVIPEQAFPIRQWHIDAEENQRYSKEVADSNPLYATYAHPHWLLSTANTALVQEFEMPAWIHVGSELCIHSAIKVGDTITVNAVPVEKWERKGHQFVRLYLSYHRGTELTTEIMHTAIFRIAQ
ncbi:MAG: hypothetical protein AB8B93_09925 [Pseudomonadales bacterium]